MKMAWKRSIVMVGLLAVACGGSGSNPVAPATPAPSAAPPTTVAPAPEPTPAALSCTLGPSEYAGPCQPWSKAKKGYFLGEIGSAITTLQQEKPDLFTTDGKRTYVTNGNVYVINVAKILERDFGICAQQGRAPDEVWVKHPEYGNGIVSEHVDILTADGQPQRSWEVTCKPAMF